ncbi:MAG: hypothetical protein ACRDHY_09850 [Anaerolineales bacterium]
MLARPAIAAVVAVTLFAACGERNPVAPASTTPGVEAAHAGGSDGVSTADVVTFADAELVVGSSRLVRNAAGVSYRLSTTGLEPGTAATLWIVIFNRPEECAIEGFCGVSEDDFLNPDVMTDVMFAAGSLVGGSGKATFAGRRAVRDRSGSLHQVLGLPLFGLLDAREAEIHLVVRTHGPIIRGMKRAMTRTFNGGCGRVDPVLGPLPEHPFIGPEGPNVCEDVHFAVHQP